MNTGPLDLVPLWSFFLLATGIGMFGLEGGYRVGKWRHNRKLEEKEAPVAATVAAVLGLLGLMLAITFNMAATQFEARRSAVLEEVNSIGTTFLRMRLLPEPQRSEMASLLREYTELRVGFIATARCCCSIDRTI